MDALAFAWVWISFAVVLTLSLGLLLEGIDAHRLRGWRGVRDKVRADAVLLVSTLVVWASLLWVALR